jgi:hypothetical protein
VISEFALLRAVGSIGRVPVTEEAAVLEALHDERCRGGCIVVSVCCDVV